jgi:hypothetical protein
MVGVDPTTRLLEFHGDGSEDPKKNLFVCERIWEAKRVTDEATKVAQLAITFRNRAMDWYMNLAVNNPQGVLTTVAKIKQALITEF